HRRDREAVAGRGVADDHVYVCLLNEVAELGHLLRRAAAFIEVHEFERRAAKAHGVVRGRYLAGVELLGNDFRGLPGRHAEWPGRRAGHEGYDADLDRLG